MKIMDAIVQRQLRGRVAYDWRPRRPQERPQPARRRRLIIARIIFAADVHRTVTASERCYYPITAWEFTRLAPGENDR